MKIDAVFTIRMIFMLGGLALFGLDFVFYARKKMSDNYNLFWTFFSMLLIVLGAIKRIWRAITPVDGAFLIPMTVVMIALILSIFLLTSALSVLRRKNQELAMHVSLINQENEYILHRIQKLEDKGI